MSSTNRSYPRRAGHTTGVDAAPLDVARTAFRLLTTGPEPISIDGRLFDGLPDRWVPLDELRDLLLARDCAQVTRDAVWAHLVLLSRTRGNAWTVGCAGMGLPALTRVAARLSARFTADPAAEALLRGEMSDEAVHWLQTNFLKTELEPGHCLRLPAEGPCECDLALTCAKFLTTSEYTRRLRARLDREDQLIADAQQRGWQREVERHQATKRRLQQLLHDLA